LRPSPLAELRDVEKIAAELNLRLPVDEASETAADTTPSVDTDISEPDTAPDDGHEGVEAATEEAPAPLDASAGEPGKPSAEL
ncbi:MAG: hypothetical protein OEV31_03435, partial [Gammaproteobacteria bacterium]|nr:hypothetical protein [Gammaproteobacteria bacterium]